MLRAAKNGCSSEIDFKGRKVSIMIGIGEYQCLIWVEKWIKQNS